MRLRPVVWLAVVVILLGARSARAQSGTATLSGTVSDETGAMVPEVALTLTNDATQLRVQSTSDSKGLFTFTLLSRGRYVLTTARQGFLPVEVRGLVMNVDDKLQIKVILKVAGVGETLTVSAEPPRMQTSPAVATVVDRQFVENLPLNGRSFQSLLAVTPGVVFTGQFTSGIGQFSVNGQRTNANYFMVDGVGANVEAGANYWASQEAAGVTPALNAVGGTQSLLSVDALEEFSIQTSTYSAEFGRQPGGQISLVSRAGTNQAHGSVSDYFRNDALSATDWFTLANNLPHARLHQNQFGATLGGPLRRDHTFFFASYEGLRLVQPQTVSTDVPSLSSRAEAWPALKPLLDSIPIPTGPENPATRKAPFLASYSAPSSFDATSIRVDHEVTAAVRLFGRFNYSPSVATSRNLNNVVTDSPTLRTTTVGLTQVIGSTMTHDVRFNDTSAMRPFQTVQDDFGGAIPIAASAILPPGIPASTPIRLQLSMNSIASPYYTLGQFQRQRQFNLVDTWTWVKRSHLIKAGGDYRELRPVSQPWEYFYFVRFNSVAALQTGVPSSLTQSIQALDHVNFRFRNLGTFISDTWRASPRLTLDLGVRWDVNPPPTLSDGKTFTTVTGFEQPATLQLAPAGTPIYPTDYTALAPRAGAAYVLSDRPGREQVVRGGFGVYHDIGAGEAARVSIAYPFVRVKDLPAGLPYPFDAAAVARPPLTSPSPPYNGQTFVAFPDHKTPTTYEWSMTFDQSLGRSQTVTLSYVGAAGRNLLRRENYQIPNANASFTGTTVVDVSRSNAVSDYKALQAQYRRRLSHGLQATASYTLSKSEDTVSSSTSNVFSKSDKINPDLFRGPSDFDRRHVFSAAITYAVPAVSSGPLGVLTRDWSIGAIVQAQSAPPVLVYTNRDLGSGSFSVLPDSVPGVPVYLDDPTAPGGWRLNPAAFSVPVEPRLGNAPRNSVRGFPFRQLDLSLARGVALVSGVKLQVRVDVFNVLNTTNFGAPSGFLGSTNAAGALSPSSSFGRASSSLDNTFGGTNGVYRLYAAGGPRSAQLSARIAF